MRVYRPIKNDLLDPERIVYPLSNSLTTYITGDRNDNGHFAISGCTIIGGENNTIRITDGTYEAKYEPEYFTEKVYSREDMDKIVMMLTLFIDDSETRAIVEDTFQSWKDYGKI